VNVNLPWELVMDLNFSPEDIAFRDEAYSFLYLGEQ